MKYKVFLILVLVCVLNSFSQNEKFSLEVNYPLTIDNNFIGERSYGVIDLGVKYKIKNLNVINLGLGINGGVLIDNTNQANFPQDFLRTIYTVQPKVFGEFNLNGITKLHPFVAVGYSFVIIQLSGSNNGVDVSNMSDTLGGLGLGLGVSYDILPKIFIQAQYDYSKVDSGNSPDISYNTNFSLLKLGIGIRL
jgi:opacity protein-like surface antigen